MAAMALRFGRRMKRPRPGEKGNLFLVRVLVTDQVSI
jgi:hypothetical protein